MSPAELLESYFTTLSRLQGFSELTVRNHRSLLRRWMQFCRTQRTIDIDTAQPEDILAWVDFRQQSNSKVKDATIARDLCVLRTFYTWRWEQQISPENPASCLPEFVCNPYGAADYLSIDECFRMLEAIDSKDPLGLRNYTIIALMWSTGVRGRELRMLSWEDVDLQDGHIKIRHGKGQTQRMIFLNERVHKDFLRYQRNCLGTQSGPVFPAIQTFNARQKGVRRLSSQRLGDIVKTAARAAGISRNIGPHTFRHTFATQMFEAGVDIEDIKEILGHMDVAETTRYIHITAAAAKRLLSGHLAQTWQYGKEST
jgi:site-specific recombinase XerD